MGRYTDIHLKILIPTEVFFEENGIQHVVIDTTEGSCGILPNRLDFVAILEAGIMLYEKQDAEASYIAHDIGVAVKIGNHVTISTHNAIKEAELGKIKESLHKELKKSEQSEMHIRKVIADLEKDITTHTLGV